MLNGVKNPSRAGGGAHPGLALAVGRAVAGHVSQNKTDKTMNKFIPQNNEFHVAGFFEEFIDAETYKFLGIREVAEPDRPLGAPGRTCFTLTEPLHLVKGYKKKPVVLKPGQKVYAMVQMICGQKKDTGFENSPKRNLWH